MHFKINQTVFYTDRGEIKQGKIIEVTLKPKVLVKLLEADGSTLTLTANRLSENLAKAKIALANFKLFRFEKEIPSINEGLALITDENERKLAQAKVRALLAQVKV